MPLVTATTLVLLLAALTTTVLAQTCYYPDQSVAETDVPCGGESAACCPPDTFCTSDGLCTAGGVLTRSSCTSQSWQDPTCPRACKSRNTSGAVALTPCGDQTFTCGLNTTDCITGNGIVAFQTPSALVLRPDQISALLKTAPNSTASSTTSSSSASPTFSPSEPIYMDGQRMYPSSTVLALGLGMGFPLVFLAVAVVVMFKKLEARGPKPLYDPPDHHSLCQQPPVPTLSRPSIPWPRPSTSTLDGAPTIQSSHSTHTLHDPAATPRSFLDRYAFKSKEDLLSPDVHELGNGNPRYELGSQTTHSRTPSRAELKGSQPGEDTRRSTQEGRRESSRYA